METLQLKEKIKNADLLFRQYSVDIAYLFGSQAVQAAHRHSDIDIALVVPDGIASEHFLNIEMELEVKLGEILGVENLDIRVINKSPLKFQGEVLKKGILVYSRAEDRRVDFETKTRLDYFDFLFLLNQLRKEFFKQFIREKLLG